MKANNTINAKALRTALENDEPVFILDVHPPAQREEGQIHGSRYLDAYKRLNDGDYTILNEIEIPADAKLVTVCAAGISVIHSAIITLLFWHWLANIYME